MTSIKRTARAAGILYLLIFIIAPFGFFFVRSSLIVPGDAAATANNILASASLFRAGIVSESIVFLSEVVIVALLYRLFRPVNKTLTMAMVFARLSMAVMQGINLLNYVFVLLLLSGAGYLAAFQPAQLHALALLFLDAYEYVALIWGLFFGLHLLLLGYLVIRSGYFPALLGILLALAAAGYLVDSFGNFLLPQSAEFLSSLVIIVAVPGELAFTLWLLIKGINAEAWQVRARAAAGQL